MTRKELIDCLVPVGMELWEYAREQARDAERATRHDHKRVLEASANVAESNYTKLRAIIQRLKAGEEVTD
jgi:hypothetical protein